MQLVTTNANAKRNDWVRGKTPTYKIVDEVAVHQNGDRFFVCDKDDRAAAREVSIEELKVLLTKPLTFIFWRAKGAIGTLKALGLNAPEKWECAYTGLYLLTDGSTKVMNLDRAFDYYHEEGVPETDLERVFALWWMNLPDDIKADPKVLERYNREKENIKRSLAEQPQQ
jgi:hypothetical protein